MRRWRPRDMHSDQRLLRVRHSGALWTAPNLYRDYRFGSVYVQCGPNLQEPRQCLLAVDRGRLRGRRQWLLLRDHLVVVCRGNAGMLEGRVRSVHSGLDAMFWQWSPDVLGGGPVGDGGSLRSAPNVHDQRWGRVLHVHGVDLHREGDHLPRLSDRGDVPRRLEQLPVRQHDDHVRGAQ